MWFSVKGNCALICNLNFGRWGARKELCPALGSPLLVLLLPIWAFRQELEHAVKSSSSPIFKNPFASFGSRKHPEVYPQRCTLSRSDLCYFKKNSWKFLYIFFVINFSLFTEHTGIITLWWYPTSVRILQIFNLHLPIIHNTKTNNSNKMCCFVVMYFLQFNTSCFLFSLFQWFLYELSILWQT